MGEKEKKSLMEKYKTLPAFPDSALAIKELKKEGHRIYAFSNGSHQAVKGLLEHNHIFSCIDPLYSCSRRMCFGVTSPAASEWRRDVLVHV